MGRYFRKLEPEIVITGLMMALMYLASALFSLPIIVPSGASAQFVGIHYVYPLVAVAVLGIITFLIGRRETSSQFILALPCYVLVLFAHFNIKLWIPHINHTEFDNFYWKIDQEFLFIVHICMFVRRKLVAFIPYEANFYMISYIALFYCSFAYHALRTPEHFRKLILAVLLLQVFGTITYLIAPAVGPFLYEAGVNPIASEGQRTMLEFYRHSVADGPRWLTKYGGDNFTIGLAAMPSLHAAGAFLFFLFARKHGKVLLPLYGFILTFILVTAVANRWHYLVDIPVGLAIAWISFVLAEYLVVPTRGPVQTAEATSPPALTLS